MSDVPVPLFLLNFQSFLMGIAYFLAIYSPCYPHEIPIYLTENSFWLTIPATRLLISVEKGQGIHQLNQPHFRTT